MKGLYIIAKGLILDVCGSLRPKIFPRLFNVLENVLSVYKKPLQN